ncbi:hypothetical protein PTTG_01970 [Puccinia triticina 1-1 BBBD Race 1]|uniref:Uncharacterized protein n=1 Tax=Puccinia triticina (isolate 1-1 / race 1 (BBBD)) TaxID=630390 RepID=A0A0C4EMI0_PUCT1|nr:hypothetical protein PTTG_01970 [Puccinia triticina 1-1 BBBD Race 1]
MYSGHFNVTGRSGRRQSRADPGAPPPANGETYTDDELALFTADQTAWIINNPTYWTSNFYGGTDDEVDDEQDFTPPANPDTNPFGNPIIVQTDVMEEGRLILLVYRSVADVGLIH